MYYTWALTSACHSSLLWVNTQSLKAPTYNHSLKETGAVSPPKRCVRIHVKGREDIETGVLWSVREMKIIKSGVQRASEAPAADGSRTAQGHKRGALDTCRRVPVPLSGCFVQGGCGCAVEEAVKGSVTCEKETLILSLWSVFLSNTIYSSFFTLCICLAWAFRPVSAMVHTKQVELRLKYCQPSRREKPLTDTASGMAAYTLKWHYSLSLFFSITLSLCFFLFLFSPIRHQSSLATKLGTGLGVGCISYS